jgi:PadR family transcriptional regulator PadR
VNGGIFFPPEDESLLMKCNRHAKEIWREGLTQVPADQSLRLRGGQEAQAALADKASFDGQQECATLSLSPVDRLKGNMPAPKSEVLQGTLDLLVLKTLDSMGPMHGFGIAMRIQQVSEDLLQLNQGTLYPALLRLEQRGWIASKWGVSENNRKAKYYSLTRAGRKQMEEEAESWGRMSAMINRVVRTS